MMRLPRRIFIEGPYESATLNVIGLSCLYLTPGLVLAGIVEWASSSSHDELSLFFAAGISLITGLVLRTFTSLADDAMEKPKAVFSVVSWSWVGCVVIGVLPYLLSGVFSWSEFDNALFETISGFSCTGSTVLTDIESHGRGILLWRQLTQWYGGMGMIVLAVTVLPVLGVGGLKLMAAESPGHTSDKLKERATQTAKALWSVYFGVTVAIALLLWSQPSVTLYDGVAHAMSTAATGGFSPYNSSIGHFNSYSVEGIIVAGMFLCAMSFNLQYRFIKSKGDFKVWSESSEWKLYVKITLTAISIVFLLNWLVDSVNASTAFRDSLFNVVALASSTGFGNVRPNGIGDFVLWGTAAQLILLFLMTVGGTFGSTSGGMKMFRLMIGLKSLRKELKLLQYPTLEFPIKVGRSKVEERIVASALGFIALFMTFVIIGTLLLTAFGDNLVTSLSGAISAMSNMGPALGEAGPTANFLEFSRPGRWVLSVLMVVGRLEIYVVLLMFLALSDRLLIRK